MCGIAGIIGNVGDSQLVMNNMLLAQHHRGPDARGSIALDGYGILGHNRLSIIDLSDSANQPFLSNDGRYALVFNGEIYNYIELKNRLAAFYDFKTKSDTEVLLAAFIHWGKDCLQHFIGMFSFAIWDKQNKSLFAARDRFGVKPFHYGTKGGVLYFASEIKTMWAAGFPRKPKFSVWAGYLTFGTYGMPEETFWEDIVQLPGGHYLEWTQSGINIQRWYDFISLVEAISPMTEAEAAEEWLSLAKNSISLRFRADVPVGFNISGGLDSSLLLALVNQYLPSVGNVKAFTFYTGDNRYDELPWVQELINQTTFPLHKVKLEALEVPELARQISNFEDEPFGGIPTLAYSKILHKAKSLGTLVLLDGQGMDEAWAGYDYYLNKADVLIQGSEGSPFHPECLSDSLTEMAVPLNFPKPFDNRLQNLQYRDLFFTKIPRALRFNDRISMMHSTELREPFLDHRLVELAFSLPASFKIKGDQQKWMIRGVAKNLLQGKITLAPKRPLQTPQREWLAGELVSWADEKVRMASDLPFFKSNAVLSAWDEYKKGDKEQSFYIWQWISAAEFLADSQ